MKQQINFYRGPGAAPGFQLDASAMAVFALVLGVVCASISIIGVYQNHRLSQRIQSSQAALAASEAQINDLRLAYPEPSVNPALVAEAEQLQRKVDGMRGLLVRVEGDEWRRSGGFTPYFEGLARRTQARLWLTAIRLQSGGKDFELAGKALESEMIPQLVQSLGAEPAFQNKAFAELSIRRGDQAEAPVEFSLRTSAFKAEPDG